MALIHQRRVFVNIFRVELCQKGLNSPDFPHSLMAASERVAQAEKGYMNR